MEPNSSLILEKIKNKEDLRLYDINSPIISLCGREKEIFSYITECNMRNELPTYNDLEKGLNLTKETIKNYTKVLRNKEILIAPTSAEVTMFFGNILNIKRIFSDLGIKISRKKKFKNPQANNYKRLFVALAKDNGKPVYSGIFYE